ncbi:MAG: NADP-dependent malic enzyme [Nanoarchaeota archaeon]
MDIYKESLDLHKKNKGKLGIISKVPLKDKKDLSLAYTPGVAEPCREIAKDISKVYEYTIKQNTVGVVTDGSAVLGLGNIGAEAALPVMEGKCILMKEFADIDAFPICIKTQDADEIINIVKNIAPVFGGINLEDISAPRCFEIERALQGIGIPVFHDDQHGTAIVILAALINSLKIVGKKFEDVTVVINGAGAAGIAITKFLKCADIKSDLCSPVKDIIVVDTKGIIYRNREDLSEIKKEISLFTNKNNIKGGLADAMKNADVFIGVSAPNVVTEEMIKSMNKRAIVFAMSNPVPEIMPDIALRAGAEIVGTGRSDFPNQINNVLAFPGVFKGALDAKAKVITPEMKYAAAYALAECVNNPKKDKVLPNPLDKNVPKAIAEAVRLKAIEQGVIRD